MDLSTTYLGRKLRNPIVVSSSSLTGTVEGLQALEEAGAGAVVLKSLFEEQLLAEEEQFERAMNAGAYSFATASSHLPALQFDFGPQEYVRFVREAKKAVGVPVIASLNCVGAGTWAPYASALEEAGADALELNIYAVPSDPAVTSADIERAYLQIVEQVRKTVRIPLAVKLSPSFTSVANIVAELERRGADAVVLFNRFYQPDLDIDDLRASSRVVFSRTQDVLLPMRWIALLYGRVKLQLAATTGIHDGRSALKVLFAGASVAMVCSALFEHKAQHIGRMLSDMQSWLQHKGYNSVNEIRGILSQKTCPDPEAFERAQYIKILVGHD